MAAPTRIPTLPRALSAADERLIAASNRFGLRLFREVEDTTRDTLPNLFLSPLSVTMALGMLYTGAAGETEAAMGRTLEFEGLTPEEVNRAYRGLIQMLRGLDPGVHFSLGNSIWCRQGISFTPSFLEASHTYFDARVEALDFSDPAAAGHINDWARRATEGRIAEIVSSPLPPLAWMYLLNAIYFKGDWTAPFVPALTRSGLFRRADGSTTPVRMMSRDEAIGVRMSDDQNPLVVDLPYGGRAFSMTIALPREPAGISSLLAGLTPERWSAWMHSLRFQQCEVRLPKFKLENDLILNGALCALGMGIAFEPGRADFGHMRPERDGYVTQVRHKSYVDVNEEGTEAAAATSVMLYGSSSRVRVVVVDRPFVFAIRDKLSGTILFLGRVLDPAA